MHEFKVNDYITLKLESDKTIIYVAGERFRQCKQLILNISITEITELDEIKSIDEAIEKLGKEMEGITHNIPPEAEFWGHCSNLQVWYENNYDTKLLHSNLAFPLLKKLVDAGDPIARRIFKEEIIKRLGNGYPSVVEYLITEGFLDSVNREELLINVIIPEEAEVISELERITKSNFFLVSRLKDSELIEQTFSVRDNHIVELDIAWDESEPQDLPESLTRLKYLKTLYYSGVHVKKIPKIITRLKSLQNLKIFSEELEQIPIEIQYLTSLRTLLVAGGLLKSIPEAVSHLQSLESLAVVGTKVERLPESIEKIKSLKFLTLKNNQITEIPENIVKLKKLEILNISKNPITRLPESLILHETLKKLVISKERLNERITPILDELKKRDIKVLEV